MSKILLFVCLAGSLLAQTREPVKADTIVARVDGKDLTVEEIQKMISALPPPMQQTAARDRKQFLQQYALMQRLVAMAEKAKLDQQSPLKEAIAFGRMQALMNAQLDAAYKEIIITVDEQKRYYEEHKDDYAQAKVTVIYVSFSSAPAASVGAKRPLTEAQARAKIERIRAEIVAGADFVKMVKLHSEDATSAAKDGDFGTIRRTDNIPEAIRNVVFALKPKEISEPIRQPNGFYLFRLEEASTRSFEAVRDEIFTKQKEVRFKEWLAKMNSGLDVKYLHDEYFWSSSSPIEIQLTPAQP